MQHDRSNLDIIFETLSGSWLYGTNTPTSDTDIRAVCFTPVEVLLGLNKFEQHEVPKDEEEDTVIYGLNRFCELALQANPNLTELLFAPATGQTCLSVTGTWLQVLDMRNEFLSKKCIDSFSGYALGQLKKMQNHYHWLMHVEPEKPDPKDFGMYITDKGSNQWSDPRLKELYNSDLRKYNQYQNWIETRNPERFELEKKYGYDTKDAMHLIRLQEQAMELLADWRITLPRRNAKELLEIRNGKYSYEQLIELAERNFELVRTMEEGTKLPSKPDYDKVNKELMQINKHYIFRRIKND